MVPSFSVIDMPPANDSIIPISNIDREKLARLVQTKDQDILWELGGVEGVLCALRTSSDLGVRGNSTDLSRRRSTFLKGAFSWISFFRFLQSLFFGKGDYLFFSILVSGIVLIVAGILVHGLQTGWTEGATVLLSCFMFAVLGAYPEIAIVAYFEKVSKARLFAVVKRNGLKQQIWSAEIVVGDIVFLRSGEIVPVDGIFLDGDDHLVLKLNEKSRMVEIDHSNPFLSSGAELVQGNAKMVVTCVGKNTNKKERSNNSCTSTQLEAQVNTLTRKLESWKLLLALGFLALSLLFFFLGHTHDDKGNVEFRPGKMSAGKVFYAFVDYVLSTAAITMVIDTSNYAWAVKVNLAHAIEVMNARDVIIRNISAWEKLGLGIATVNVVDANKTSAVSQVENTKFFLVPQFSESIEASSSLIPSDVLQLIHQCIVLNTTGTAYRDVKTRKHEFSGSPIERAILSLAALELGMDWKKLNDECTILRVEAHKRRVVMQKDRTFQVHTRGRAELVLAMCSSYYDASGVLNFMDEDMRNLLEHKVQSISSNDEVQLIALAHRQVCEEELTDLNEKEDCYNLLGFVALKMVNQGETSWQVSEDAITREDSKKGTEAAELGESAEGEDDTSVSVGSEEATVNTISEVVTSSDEEHGSSTFTDQMEVTKFCLVEDFIGSEAPTLSSSVDVLELMKQKIGLTGAGNVTFDGDGFSGSLVDEAILSWANSNLDLEEEVTNYKSRDLSIENRVARFAVISLENGTLHLHKNMPAETKLKMCSSYYVASGDIRVLGDEERIMLEQKIQTLESSNCYCVAFAVSSQVEPPAEILDLSAIQDDRTVLLGILVLVCGDRDHSGILAPGNIVSNNATVDDAVNSKPEVSVSMVIETTGKSPDIVILDGDYHSVPLIHTWSRFVLRSTQMFTLFQLTANATSIINTYMAALVFPKTSGQGLANSLVMLIWINLGMGLVAAVAYGRERPQFSTEKPASEVQEWKLVTPMMLRNAVAQVTYQVLAIGILQSRGRAIFNYNNEISTTVTFVTTIFLQVFNMICARKIEDKNIFSGISQWFICLIVVLLIVPFLAAEFLAGISQRLNLEQWTMCIGIAMGTWPVDFAAKCVPVRPLTSAITYVFDKIRKGKGLLTLGIIAIQIKIRNQN